MIGVYNRRPKGPGFAAPVWLAAVLLPVKGVVVVGGSFLMVFAIWEWPAKAAMTGILTVIIAAAMASMTHRDEPSARRDNLIVGSAAIGFVIALLAGAFWLLGAR